MKQLIHISLTLLFLFGASQGSTASDNEFCVICSTPHKSYLCEINTLTAVNRSALGLYCIRKISEQNNHASCSVSRIKKEKCGGEKVSFNFHLKQNNSVSGNARILPGSQEDTLYQDEEIATGSVHKEENREPETLIELTDQVAESTGKQLKKAGNSLSKTGDAISDAAKSTWRCIGSLFSDC